VSGFSFVEDFTQLRVDDLLEHRCERFGIVTQWRVVGIYLGATGVQGLIDVLPVTKSAPVDTPAPFSVPEQMTRHLVIIRRKDCQ